MQDTDLKRVRFSVIISFITLTILLVMRWKTGGQFLLFDRLFDNGGVWQIFAITIFSAWVSYEYYNRQRRAELREPLWLLFGILFFSQLLLGIVADSLFLLSGQLHFPIPSVILTGSIYRMSIGFMPILFLITVLLSGGAWCSYLCYFGSFDSSASGKRNHISSSRIRYRLYTLLVFLSIAIILRIINASEQIVLWMAAASGIIGLLLILFISHRKKTMVHCSYFCPLGTVVSYLKYLSPFRYRISNHCTKCFGCTKACKYGALSKQNIEQRKPSIGCTQCGDCASVCKHNAFEYHFLWFSPKASELIFVGMVVIIYSLFLCVARV